MYNITNPTEKTYETSFWNALRKEQEFYTDIKGAKVTNVGSYVLPAIHAQKYLDALREENFFRRFGTVTPMMESAYTVHINVSEGEAEWVPEGGVISEDEEHLKALRFEAFKLACITKIHMDLLADQGFDFESWMLTKFARRFGRAEAKAFLTGTGINQPVGILHDQGGAEVGVTTKGAEITFDEVMTLFHSLDQKFRQKAIWVMNDDTALALRKLKDKDGNYLWDPSAEKLLGKTVVICNEMPGIAPGAKPIAFGDFSYYWIMDRVPFAVRPLREKFVIQQLRGYVGYEHLDAKLIRPETIQVMQMAG